MAQLIRSARLVTTRRMREKAFKGNTYRGFLTGRSPVYRSGSQWTDNELFASNIVIQDVDVAMFFGVPQLPPTTISPVILNNTFEPAPPAVISNDDRLFFDYLDRLDSATIAKSAAVNDFARHILRMLNFGSNRRLIATTTDLSFTMSRGTPDIVILDAARCYLLIFQEHKRIAVTDEPEPQLIAKAIAAFVANNHLRVPPLPQQTFPAIIMVASCPIFYKIPVTQVLVDAVITAQYPAQPTIVQRLVPPVRELNSYRRYGMNPLQNRGILFQCLEAMRGLLVT